MEFPSELRNRVGEGHVLEWDPPAAFTATRRWTCARCGDAVLVNGSVVFGSATREGCAPGRPMSLGALL